MKEFADAWQFQLFWARNDAVNIIGMMAGRQAMELAAKAQQKPRPKGRLRRSDRFKVATYNMAAPSKMQLQLLDTLGYDCIFLPEVWDKAYTYMDYGGPKRFLATEVAGRHDRPGAVAWRLSGYAATMLANWGTCPGAEARTCWLRFEIAGGRHLGLGTAAATRGAAKAIDHGEGNEQNEGGGRGDDRGRQP